MTEEVTAVAFLGRGSCEDREEGNGAWNWFIWVLFMGVVGCSLEANGRDERAQM